MRHRDEIEADVKDAIDCTSTSEAESARLLRLVVELLLDIRERQEDLYMATDDAEDIGKAVAKAIGRD